MTEIEQLAELLKKHWQDMTCGTEIEGFSFETEIEGDEGRWTRHMGVITRGPSGTYYRWNWERGLTERQEHIGPAEYGEPDIDVVQPVKETVEVIRWEKVA